MGTELMRVCVKEENDELPSIPPGFESYASFTLKKAVPGGEKAKTNSVTCGLPAESATAIKSVKMETDSNLSDASKPARSLRQRPWINFVGCDDDDENNKPTCPKLGENVIPKPSLPKGVIRGCAECTDCQKVIARWRPDDACRLDLEDVPVFYPTEEEFEDTLNYIAKIRPTAEKYGISRIVPPPSWKPPCPLKEKQVWEGCKFATRVQRVDKLQNRNSMKKISKNFDQMRKKRRKCMKMRLDSVADSGSGSSSDNTGVCELETFGFEPGPQFSLKEFQKYADVFKAQYFRKSENPTGAKPLECWEPSIKDIEGEYWRIVEKATEEIEVLYGADLETGVFGSGFPRTSSEEGSSLAEKYVKSGWNLNNLPRLPGSLLSYESSDISGVLVPWLYIGMCFSSFCWHVEDHHLYSLNYMHWGAPKMWYGVGGKDAVKLEEAMRKHLPDLFEEQPDLLHKLVTQLSPSILKASGVPVYRCIQSAGEFVLTFPRAYHAGFNCGFNCAEAVNVAPVDWLSHGQIATELYCQQGRKTSISHDKLLLGAAREAVKAHWEFNLLKKNTPDNLRWVKSCRKDGILAKALKARVDMERTRREFLCNSSLALKMHSNFDATNERECCICFFDLHLSAAGCRCSPEKYACLTHVKQLCSCPWVTKYFLFRYDIDELNLLVEALEGKLSSVYRWARQDLGLALSAHTLGNNMSMDTLSPPREEKVPEDLRPQAPAVSGKDLRKPVGSSSVIDLEEKSKLSEFGLSVKETKEQSTRSPFLKSVKEEPLCHSSDPKASIRLPSQGEISSLEAAKPDGVEIPYPSSPNNIILLSDDEDNEPRKSFSERESGNPSGKHLELKEKQLHRDEKMSHHGLKKEGSAGEAPSRTGHPISQRETDPVLDARMNTFSPNNDLVMTGDDAPKAEAIGLAHDISSRKDLDNHGCQNPNSDDRLKSTGGLGIISDVADGARSNLGAPCCSQNNSPDRLIRQKGPRIAKVVRRINCNTELLAFGSVLPGKSWCNNRTIFPKGFQSRVKYINILDPINMCWYISEILDAGRGSPLFMVYLESHPSEVFINISATKCWEMVRDRVNQEITKQHKAGKSNLPPLQPPGSLDGFEMFGFSSPAIVQAIEALDRNRVCTDYWDSRPYSRPQVQFPANPHPRDGNSSGRTTTGQRPLPAGTGSVLRGLFRKANPEELTSLQQALSEASTDLVTRLLNEEIRNRI
ncbi:PREDICTED: putative lysine-specific demethylase JMJ16 isoform X2 [Tarenaya hassleriana]|uniref:putative lysine-specific demethylase JMJ16 isoform X1 n=1 Tax=Tarenaya hassleriana TaxID=28532 RepID=UPI00053C38A4|nr:PREDICTED: putative lysine-specific demethylase JMJ16 isoform X1 [Tarenaya hassleriana]XP_010528756.1 PREDICTED: putative lysine-specific demethylase JMJ16 isoform X2 [Tarenaya hassleriana]